MSDNSGRLRRLPRFGRPDVGVVVVIVGSGRLYGKYVMVYMMSTIHSATRFISEDSKVSERHLVGTIRKRTGLGA